MRIDPDTDRLIEEALRFGEYETKEDVVHAALREYIAACKVLKQHSGALAQKKRRPPRQPRKHG
jgi:Arc/MetJ-type ribon-helix-helix transcriptional regulator